MTLILSIYGFVGLVPLFFLVKVTFLAIFLNIERGVWLYRHAHDVTLVTLILNIYIWVRGSNFNRSSLNLGHTDRQPIHTLQYKYIQSRHHLFHHTFHILFYSYHYPTLTHLLSLMHLVSLYAKGLVCACLCAPVCNSV